MSINDIAQKLEKFKNMGYIIPHKSLLKTPQQIEGIRKSGEITTQILDLLEKEVKPGITTAEVDKIVYEYTVAHNAIPAPLNYNGFPKSVCTSINDVVCHGIPDEKTVLKSGDIVNIDVSTILDGYFSDASRMYMIGDVSPNAKKLVEVTKECLDIGTQQVKPFASINDIGRAIEPFANNHGYSVVRDLGGHGVGLYFHEDPHVDHFKRKDMGFLILPGMVFTIEPMINEGRYRVQIGRDNWTVTTKDGSLSAQWEYTIAVTGTGFEILAH
ncbi:methionine aminopeptidase, type I [Ruminiclostridium papyrosolvens DSM 2782]|uniref:Methionine aminopeptidase n=1 Tax=Ruminiclostridium papyrosolvens DSM 2782 TaxID=588581 RepID=F1TB39_9FIRM|nr:type I methionyl aminopeptidase [Ruminiclostridium papyrosolvens]EGD48243.1 methionine aminopeptidase, type I [Ruminiclostridium papyrosolvens DSM 2782]WES34248.1 type I methionyl aminopeptidase [Ruminiclostridium papyrosolvens DSM 2782]